MVRYRKIARLVLLAPLLLSALPADAQTRRIFAGAGVIADNDQTNSALTESIATSWTFVVGMDATSHIGVRVTFYPGHAHREDTSRSTGAARQSSAAAVVTGGPGATGLAGSPLRSIAVGQGRRARVERTETDR